MEAFGASRGRRFLGEDVVVEVEGDVRDLAHSSSERSNCTDGVM